MAQTKRKRRSKHRGTAAGMIQSRGRTGRPPSPEERKQASREQAREKRLSKAPTWQSAAKRAGLIAVFLFVVLAFVMKPKKGNSLGAAAIISLVALCFYIPTGYYLDRFIHRRALAKRAGGAKK
ncbi:MAG: hypothetical protein ACLP8S_06845 [Solirubrobacteraceae bacterium]